VTTPFIDDWPTVGFITLSYAEEHLTMHQFMYETTAADPTSRGFLIPDFESAQQDEPDFALGFASEPAIS
jgi:hypothetical protein